MTREQAKKLLPIIQAFSEGKDIETKTGSGWISIESMSFAGNPNIYRIKPEPKYRPFANAEECWKEMRKHEPFGWVIKKSNDREYNIQSVLIKEDVLYIRSSYVELVIAFNDYNFADGIPFGVKVEE